ncbi:hypothetical protein CWATWH8502_688 [Crocosphaera watsonii WH 8502]|uniref:Uncharacterized protein n=1 Tax=Crocosphaera watsonii WH 8502 TaxID=423474 RepID=T2IMY6_CROWT|nr:hypothetical protein CWATWH8502_688 [Crocosphaera watsonii WH 8502]
MSIIPQAPRIPKAKEAEDSGTVVELIVTSADLKVNSPDS